MTTPGRARDDLAVFQTAAQKCSTPHQFGMLLTLLTSVIPYTMLGGYWGYPSRWTIRFIYNHGIPRDLFQWFFSEGLQFRGPGFKYLMRTKQTFLWHDLAERRRADFEPGHIERIEKAGMRFSLIGGRITSEYYAVFVVTLHSEERARAHLALFDSIVPFLIQASQRAYPKTLLTQRQHDILERRAMGHTPKQIAYADGITERTVRMHLECIKKKLFTDDLLNAAVIAIRSGMIKRGLPSE